MVVPASTQFWLFFFENLFYIYSLSLSLSSYPSLSHSLSLTFSCSYFCILVISIPKFLKLALFLLLGCLWYSNQFFTYKICSTRFSLYLAIVLVLVLVLVLDLVLVLVLVLVPVLILILILILVLVLVLVLFLVLVLVLVLVNPNPNPNPNPGPGPGPGPNLYLNPSPGPYHLFDFAYFSFSCFYFISWQMKLTQLKCGTPLMPPDDHVITCHVYHTSHTPFSLGHACYCHSQVVDQK